MHTIYIMCCNSQRTFISIISSDPHETPMSMSRAGVIPTFVQTRSVRFKIAKELA